MVIMKLQWRMNAKRFAQWLAKARKQRGWTQGELAGKLGITLGRVSQWEQAALTAAGTASLPPLETIVLLSKIFKIDVREPLAALDVLKDEKVELTGEERRAVELLRELTPEGVGVAVEILTLLPRLQGGNATLVTRRRPATGPQSAFKAS
jgi:transcriptional regulator with XRE-family HTH domain